ncbi:MAG TPA: ABC transporter substrate-binding protein [Candidatus Acidoferrum sp.]|nr:ABC transporter substrate-binding protein [Candidatus Acidoferrum sp.]
MKSSERWGWRWFGVGVLTAVLALLGVSTAAAETTITLWSHEADEAAKVAWAETAAQKFEQKNPGVKVKMTWYQKEALGAALKAALRAGQGPDILYTEPDQTEYIENGFLLPLNDVLNWNNVETWAREAWTHNGKVYGLPKEAYTIELYYNKDWMKKLGVTLPPNGQVS